MEKNGAGARLDQEVAARYELPRNQVQAWIRDGLVLLNGRPAKTGVSLKAGDLISCQPPAPPPEALQPEPGELSLLHEDGDLLVLDKPAGLTVHPGAGRAGWGNPDLAQATFVLVIRTTVCAGRSPPPNRYSQD